MSSLLNKFPKRHRKFIKYGAPFLICILGGSFGLKEFTQLRYTFSNKRSVKPEEMAELGVKMKDPTEVTLETEFEKIKKIDIDNWDSVRISRPWEEPEKGQK